MIVRKVARNRATVASALTALWIAVSFATTWFVTSPTCAQDNAETAGPAQPNGDAGAKAIATRVSPFQKDRTDLVVDKAIAYLVSKQRKDGAITEGRHDTAMTALSIMAMASVGVQPGEPSPEGRAMETALEFVLQDDRQDANGYYGAKDGSRMYGHGIITLMLTEMLGMSPDQEVDRKVHERCQKAIDLILSSQSKAKSHQFRGGWRYTPSSTDADLSVSVWQVMALRSAKNDGLKVPADAIEAAVDYLKRSYASPLDRNGIPDNRASGFCYTPGQTSPSFAMTAAGLLAMQVCGEYESPLVNGAADWLLEHPPKWTDRFCCYGTYYYAQGMYQRGDKHAETASQLVQEMLLDKQNGDGSWKAGNGSEAGQGLIYATSMSVLTLSVKYHYLPIYQK